MGSSLSAERLQIDFDWTPTADNVNALPEPLRRYISALETECDPSGTIRSEVHMRDDIVPALEQKCVAQAAEIERLTRAMAGQAAETIRAIEKNVPLKQEVATLRDRLFVSEAKLNALAEPVGADDYDIGPNVAARLSSSLARVRGDALEEAAKIVEGEVVGGRYFRWPCWNPKGDVVDYSDTATLTRALAKAIRALSQPKVTP